MRAQAKLVIACDHCAAAVFGDTEEEALAIAQRSGYVDQPYSWGSGIAGMHFSVLTQCATCDAKLHMNFEASSEAWTAWVSRVDEATFRSKAW